MIIKIFLRKFAVRREEMQVDMDSFDYVFYTYGLRMYGNMPFVEPLEYKEINKIEEFVIVIDTSGSCSLDLIKKFLEESYNILTSDQTFAKKVNIYMIQCDEKVQSVVNITSEEELRVYMDNFEIKGLGGTDFRPAFGYIDKLIEEKAFHQLKGMLYFTDGYGIYPAKRPNYDVAFVFIEDNYTDVDVPPWAMKLMIEPGGLMDEHKKSKRRN
jgi:predicted metal-dependent peptidase